MNGYVLFFGVLVFAFMVDLMKIARVYVLDDFVHVPTLRHIVDRQTLLKCTAIVHIALVCARSACFGWRAGGMHIYLAGGMHVYLAGGMHMYLAGGMHVYLAGGMHVYLAGGMHVYLAGEMHVYLAGGMHMYLAGGMHVYLAGGMHVYLAGGMHVYLALDPRDIFLHFGRRAALGPHPP